MYIKPFNIRMPKIGQINRALECWELFSYMFRNRVFSHIYLYILIYVYTDIYIYIYSDVNHSDVNHTQNSNGIASLFNLHEPAAPGRRHGFSLHEPNVNEAISWCSSGFGGVARGMMYGVVLD